VIRLSSRYADAAGEHRQVGGGDGGVAKESDVDQRLLGTGLDDCPGSQ
jgi:hypothetical protein